MNALLRETMYKSVDVDPSLLSNSMYVKELPQVHHLLLLVRIRQDALSF